MRRTLAIEEASRGKDHPFVALQLNNLANLLLESVNFTEAERLFRRAIEILDNHEPERQPIYQRVTDNLAALEIVRDTVNQLRDMGASETEIRRAVRTMMRPD
jgi:hypothetical protein